MKPSRAFGPLPHLRYRPEVAHCLHCRAALQYSHSVWAKPIQFLTGPAHVTNLGFRCSNAACAFGRSVYRSARAEARQVKGSGYGLDVVVPIGYLRFTEHRTREEIWRALHGRPPVQLSERHVQNLLEIYLALLRASEADPRERLAPTVEVHGGIILALDGLQPEQGNEQLRVVREVLSGAVLGAANLQQASAPVLARLLRPLRATGLPVLGVVSDAQESIRLAVAEVFPGVPPTSSASTTLCAKPPNRCGKPTATCWCRRRRSCGACGRSKSGRAAPTWPSRRIRRARSSWIPSSPCGRWSANEACSPSPSPGCASWTPSRTWARRWTAACSKRGCPAGPAPRVGQAGRTTVRGRGCRVAPGACLALRDCAPAGAPGGRRARAPADRGPDAAAGRELPGRGGDRAD